MTGQKTLEVALEEMAKLLTQQEARHKVLREEMKVDFNPLTVLLGAHDETRLHARFIGHLLDPKGNHCCGELFLEKFLEQVAAAGWAPEEGFKKEPLRDVRVSLEHSFDDGRLDLVLESKTWMLVIENKIYAIEQPDQLARYHGYLVNHKKERDGRVIYLTLDGKDAATQNKQHPPLLVSYKEHIFKWLEECLAVSWRWPNINIALQQYQRVVADLTGQNLSGMNAMKNIVEETVFRNPILLRDYWRLDGAVSAIRKQLKMKYLDELKDSLRQSGYQADVLQRCPGDPTEWKHTELLVSKPRSFQSGQEFEVWIEFHEEWRVAYIGIEKAHKKNIPADILARLDGFQKRFRKEFHGHTTEPASTFSGTAWCCRSDLFPPVPSGSSWDSFCADIADPSMRREKVLDAKGKVEAWFSFMEKIWQEAQSENTTRSSD